MILYTLFSGGSAQRSLMWRENTGFTYLETDHTQLASPNPRLYIDRGGGGRNSSLQINFLVLVRFSGVYLILAL